MRTASGQLANASIKDAFMKDVSKSLEVGEAARFLLLHRRTAERVMEGLRNLARKIKLADGST